MFVSFYNEKKSCSAAALTEDKEKVEWEVGEGSYDEQTRSPYSY